MTHAKDFDESLLRRHESRPKRISYGGYVFASFTLALMILLRRQRLLMAAIIALLPVAIPAATAYLSESEFADYGSQIFVHLVEQLHITVLAPLLALFFATMQVGEDVESNTLVYTLTRPTPRSAWVLGRFLAYYVVTSMLLTASIALTFVASTALPGIGINTSDVLLMLHYCGVALMAVMAYGALALLLGAATKRPIVYGVLLLYGWQGLASAVPGLVDFLTIKKYTDALLPVLATQRQSFSLETELGTFQKQAFLVDGISALATLFGVTVVFLAYAIYTVRNREYASSRAIGS
jgi:ABC-type transport system involved in multi-copper enzyme maturation permease subunit